MVSEVKVAVMFESMARRAEVEVVVLSVSIAEPTRAASSVGGELGL